MTIVDFISRSTVPQAVSSASPAAAPVMVAAGSIGAAIVPPTLTGCHRSEPMLLTVDPFDVERGDVVLGFGRPVDSVELLPIGCWTFFDAQRFPITSRRIGELVRVIRAPHP